jgi:DNA-directed RNA polymerase subunit delta
MSKTAKKQIDMLLNRFLKSGKKSCSLIINEHGDEDDDDYEINEYDDNDKIYGDDDEIDEDDDEIDEDDDFDDLPF